MPILPTEAAGVQLNLGSLLQERAARPEQPAQQGTPGVRNDSGVAPDRQVSQAGEQAGSGDSLRGAQTNAPGRPGAVSRSQDAAAEEENPLAPKTSREQVEKAMNEIQKVIEPVAQDLRFSIDEDSGATVVKVIDKATDEVIRQIPSEEALQIAAALDKLNGLLLKQKA